VLPHTAVIEQDYFVPMLKAFRLWCIAHQMGALINAPITALNGLELQNFTE
jgi:hypothetical protein